MIAVLDAGSSSVRALMVRDDGTIAAQTARPTLPSTPAPGLVEVDGELLAGAALECLEEVGASGAVALGITTQRATTFVWERDRGKPLAPGLGWQDLRTVGTCIALGFEGTFVAPNASVSKLAFLLDTLPHSRARARDGEVMFGTPDTWLAWRLTGQHVVDATEAATTGMFSLEAWGWDPGILEALDIPEACLPRIVPTSGSCGEWQGVPLASLVGDQQASLAGQACFQRGQVKATLGTGGIIDITGGAEPPPVGTTSWRNPDGTYPIVAWDAPGDRRFGAEAIVLTAGDAIAWLADLGLLASPADAEQVARSVDTTDGVRFVPALGGLGSPRFDFGARGTFVGLTRGSTAAHLVRAAIEGVAHCVADAMESAQVTAPCLRVDGGAAANRLLLECVADFTHKTVERAPVTDATALGAALWAGVASGVWASPVEAAALWPSVERIEPSSAERSAERDAWREAVEAAAGWLPEFSSLPL